MQATRTEQKTTEIHGGATAAQPQERLRNKKVKDLIVEKKRLVEVPYTASLSDTMNALMANRVIAVPVAAPPGQWIGAGGSMIVEIDKRTGAVRKHYIGMVTMLDILAHIAGNQVEVAQGGAAAASLEQSMQVPVSSVIGHCIESLSLWTLNCNTSLLDCMEVFSKGVHRALVPVDTQMENLTGVELEESASNYRMLTQMDVLRFLKTHEHELRGTLSRQIKDVGAVSDIVFGVTDRTRVIDAIKYMDKGALNAVPILESSDDVDEKHGQLIIGKDRKVVGTFSATDLRGCPISQLEACLNLNMVDFMGKMVDSPVHEGACVRTSAKEQVVCHPESSLGEVLDKAVNNHVHRVWVVDRSGLLQGLVSSTDMIRVIRLSLLSELA